MWGEREGRLLATDTGAKQNNTAVVLVLRNLLILSAYKALKNHESDKKNLENAST